MSHRGIVMELGALALLGEEARDDRLDDKEVSDEAAGVQDRPVSAFRGLCIGIDAFASDRPERLRTGSSVAGARQQCRDIDPNYRWSVRLS